MVFCVPLEACLVNLDLPYKIFICSDILGEIWSCQKFEGAFLPYRKVRDILMGPAERSGTLSSYSSIRKKLGDVFRYTCDYEN